MLGSPILSPVSLPVPRLFPSLALVCLSSTLMAQQGAEILSVSPTGAGRGATEGMAGDSVLEAARNPAVLAWLFEGDKLEQRLDLGFRAFAPTFRGEDRFGRSFEATDMGQVAPFLGWAQQASPEVAFGLTLLPTLGGKLEVERLTRTEIGDETKPLAESYLATEMVQVGIQPAFAVRASSTLNFGGALSIRPMTSVLLSGIQEESLVATFQGEVFPGSGTSWGEYLFQMKQFSDPNANDNFQASYSADASMDMTMALQLGAAWEPSTSTRLGLWYRSPTIAHNLNGWMTVDLSDETGPLKDALAGDPTNPIHSMPDGARYDLSVGNVAFPQQIGFGAGWNASRRSRFYFASSLTDWSSAYDSWSIDLTDPVSFGGDGMGVEDIMGGDGEMDLDLLLDWKDVVSLSFGMEHDLDSDLTLRSGLVWNSNPIRRTAATPTTAAITTLHLTFGATLWRSDTRDGDWHLAWIWSIPTEFDVGVSATVDDFTGDHYEMSVHSVFLGYTLDF